MCSTVRAQKMSPCLCRASQRLVTGCFCLLGELTSSPKSSFPVNPPEEASPLHRNAWFGFCFVFLLLLFHSYYFWWDKNFLLYTKIVKWPPVLRTQSHHQPSRVSPGLSMPTFPHYFEANEENPTISLGNIYVYVCKEVFSEKPSQLFLHTFKATDRHFFCLLCPNVLAVDFLSPCWNQYLNKVPTRQLINTSSDLV